jgi:hypothetical protein
MIENPSFHGGFRVFRLTAEECMRQSWKSDIGENEDDSSVCACVGRGLSSVYVHLYSRNKNSVATLKYWFNLIYVSIGCIYGQSVEHAWKIIRVYLVKKKFNQSASMVLSLEVKQTMYFHWQI